MRVSAHCKYRPEMAEEAKRLCENGASGRDVARVLGISKTAMYEYAARYPEFRAALKVGKAVADDRVERSLYDRANGYTYKEVKPFLDRKTNEIIYAEYEVTVPPEPQCLMFWLKNRRPEVWREVSRQELTGAGGGPVQTDSYTQIDIARRIAHAMTLALDKPRAEPVVIEQNKDSEG